MEEIENFRAVKYSNNGQAYGWRLGRRY